MYTQNLYESNAARIEQQRREIEDAKIMLQADMVGGWYGDFGKTLFGDVNVMEEISRSRQKRESENRRRGDRYFQ